MIVSFSEWLRLHLKTKNLKILPKILLHYDHTNYFDYLLIYSLKGSDGIKNIKWNEV